ncbi:MAG TPA: NfeD family protein [Hyphomicrobiaceae bacterium]|nr:NfeD family protein [Hyphomicrobiaceae bacterium]
MPQPSQDPNAVTWVLGALSLALPWLGVGLVIAGALSLSRGGAWGAALLLCGLAAIIADIAIDFVWAAPARAPSDQPDLNQRAAQLIGRVLVVADAIEGGRGRVRAGDTLWQAEGPNLPRGSEVRVAAVKATILLVERVEP